MKLSAILEDDENMAVVPLFWLTRNERQYFIRNGYEVIPIPGYQETGGLHAFKIIGNFSKRPLWMPDLSIPIWEDWKLTALYVNRAERFNSTISTTAIQMFDRLNDDEKIKILKYRWCSSTTIDYIIKYFKDHPDLLERAKNSLNLKDINNNEFKNFLTKI